MSQGDVLKVLEKKGSLTEKEIAKILDITVSSTWNCLSKLVKSGEVERIEKGIEKNGKILNLKCYVFSIKEEQKNGRKNNKREISTRK